MLRFLPWGLFALVGCGGGHGDVSGRVTFNGKPVVVGDVVFLASDSLPYTASLDESGQYRISKVPAGRAKVAVVSRNPAAVRAHAPRPGKDRPAPRPDAALAAKWFPIPDRFGDHEMSGLATTVAIGDNTYDVNLAAGSPTK